MNKTKLIIIGLTLFLLITSCDKKNEIINKIDTNAESIESIMEYSLVLFSHDNLVLSKTQHDTSGMRYHDIKYHYHDSLFSYHHGHHLHNKGHHISHRGIDSLHKIHFNYHPQ